MAVPFLAFNVFNCQLLGWYHTDTSCQTWLFQGCNNMKQKKSNMCSKTEGQPAYLPQNLTESEEIKKT